MNSRSRSTLFLIEQIIVIAVFAICASACVYILTDAYLTAQDTRDLSNALHVIESGADSFKATGGDVRRAAEIISAERDVLVAQFTSSGELAVYYNDKWLVCGEGEAVYRLLFQNAKADPDYPRILTCDLSVDKLGSGQIIAFTVSTKG